LLTEDGEDRVIGAVWKPEAGTQLFIVTQ